MLEDKALEALRQASLSEVGEVFQNCLRDIVRDSFVRILLTEAVDLCGPFHRPDSDSKFKRAGSAVGALS